MIPTLQGIALPPTVQPRHRVPGTVIPTRESPATWIPGESLTTDCRCTAYNVGDGGNTEQDPIT